MLCSQANQTKPDADRLMVLSSLDCAGTKVYKCGPSQTKYETGAPSGTCKPKDVLHAHSYSSDNNTHRPSLHLIYEVN